MARALKFAPGYRRVALSPLAFIPAAPLHPHGSEYKAIEPRLQRPIVVARRQSAKGLELPAVTSLARLWADRGRPSETREVLAPLYGWVTEGFDTPHLQEAKALLDALG